MTTGELSADLGETCGMKRSRARFVVGLVVVAAAALTLPTGFQRWLGGDEVPVDPGTFRVLSEPQDAEDLAAIESFQGEAELDLNDARLLGADRLGRQYLIVAPGTRICLVVVYDSTSAGVGCESAGNVARDGMWLGGGQAPAGAPMPVHLAILVPDEYADATVTHSGDLLLRVPNLVVVTAEEEASSQVTFHSNRYRDLQFTMPGR